ncbi:Rhodopsin, GQ-coupled [Trichoplax sp. H2]|nr:Rhodopsin, GQ-coupled [Trichoplax sp. H2]|eukprot:RDD42518.1 Rhodopsin, GQ-coupled [Trichoplax sp. H2]
MSDNNQVSASNIVWIIIGALTLITNSVILAFLLSQRSLRRPPYIALYSLLINDIAFAVAYVLPYYSNRPLQLEIPNWCILLPRIGQSLFLNMALHICFLAMIRSIQINRPFRAIEIVTRRNVLSICTILWLCSLLLVFISAINVDRLQIEHNHTLNCSQQFIITNDIELTYSLIILIISLFVLLFLCAVYYRILAVIDYHMKKTALRSSMTDITIKDRISKFINKRKAVRQALCVFSLYLIFLGPFLITLGLSYIKPLYNAVMTVYPSFRFLAFCYPIVLPFIYIAFDNEIRNAIYKRVSRKSDNQNTPTTDQTLNECNLTNILSY